MNSQDFTISDDKKRHFNDCSTKKFEDTFSQLNSAINGLYFSLKASSDKIILNAELNGDQFSSDIHKKLALTNYEFSSTKRETFVLFDKPYFISVISCSSNNVIDNNSNIITLLSHKFSDKKIAAARTNSPQDINSNSHYSYVVRETIFGFILPVQFNFESAGAIDYQSFLEGDSEMVAINKAHLNMSLEAKLLNTAMQNQKITVDSYLDEQVSIYNSTKETIDFALKEKDRVEHSVVSENKTLERIREDIESGTTRLDAIISNRDSYSDESEELQLKIKNHKNMLENDKLELNETSERITDSRAKLHDLQEQMHKARADINVTTLDMKGFSSESKSQINKYFWLAGALIAFLAAVFICMYNNAQTFVQLVDANPNISTWNILLSRLPLITSTTLIIATLSALLFYLVNNIISVSDDKMNMLKASILAEQITGSLPKNDMTDEEIRDYKRNTKIELVMNIIANKSVNIKDDKQSDTLKQVVEIAKLLK